MAQHTVATIRARVPPGQMHTRPYRARVYSHDRGDFSSVRNSKVLIYWPHGFGDWVQLAYVLPWFQPSNRYWITRFGDDNTSLMADHELVTPVYLGANSAHSQDGEAYGNRHFGLRYEEVDGGWKELNLPISLHDILGQNEIESVFWTWFPETHGQADFPFHSKARNLLRHLLHDPDSVTGLEQPLRSSINFQVDAWIARWVESRLFNWGGMHGHKLCLIGRNGYTAVGKNWGHHWREDMPPGERHEGEECRQFMRLMLRKDPRWVFLAIEDRLFEGEHTLRSQELNCLSYAQLFGTPESGSLPFGLVMKEILNLAELCVAVPAGPHHLAMAKPDLPTVGIWIEHLPSWYDEPKAASIHLVSRNVRDNGSFERPGSFVRRGAIEYRIVCTDTRIITGQQVIEAVEQLIY